MQKQKKVITASMIGNTLEFYDFSLYGFFAPILSQLFFPSDNSLVSLIQTLGVFALGFITRPLGGIIFGHIGDKFGRKKALSYSVLLMSIPTMGIGLLPTFDSIGIWAPFLLVLCRMCQGLCAGGEYNGAALFALEHNQEKKRGFIGGLITSASEGGALLGLGMGYIFTHKIFPEEFWRIPFILGLVAGVAGYYIRRSLPESPEFEEKQAKKLKMPLWEVITDNPRGILAVIGIACVCGSTFYTQIVFINAYLSEIVHMDLNQLLGIMAPLMAFKLILLQFMGKLADRWDPYKLMLTAASLLIVFSFPIFVLLNMGTFFSVLVVHLLILLLNSAFVAPSHVVMMNNFKPKYRYSGVAFSFSIGMTLFGGTTPMLFMFLINKTHYPYIPAFFLMFYALFGFFAVLISKKAFALQNYQSAPLKNNKLPTDSRVSK